MKNLLQRIRRLVNAHPEIEIGANIYWKHGQYRLGRIEKGKRYYVNVQENPRIAGQFHSHPNGTEPSRGDWRTLVAPLEIVATPQCIYVGEFKSIKLKWEDYICQFEKVEI